MRFLLLELDNTVIYEIVSKALSVDFSASSGRQRSLCPHFHLIQMDSLVEFCIELFKSHAEKNIPFRIN